MLYPYGNLIFNIVYFVVNRENGNWLKLSVSILNIVILPIFPTYSFCFYLDNFFLCWSICFVWQHDHKWVGNDDSIGILCCNRVTCLSYFYLTCYSKFCSFFFSCRLFFLNKKENIMRPNLHNLIGWMINMTYQIIIKHKYRPKLYCGGDWNFCTLCKNTNNTRNLWRYININYQ